MPAHNTGGASKWRSIGPDKIVRAPFGDEIVVFHRPSGTTHVLNAASAFLIAEILIEPKSADEIARTLSIDAAVDPDGRFERELLATLDYLEELGLLERLR